MSRINPPASYPPSLGPGFDPSSEGNTPEAGDGLTLMLDNFTDTNGTLLTAHTPDTDTVGTGWEKYTNTLSDCEVQSNQAQSSAVGAGGNTIDVGVSDFTSRIVGTANNNGRVGLGRGQAAGGGSWTGAADYIEASWVPKTSVYAIYEVLAGSFFVRSTTAGGAAGAVDYYVVFNGQTITMYDSAKSELITYTQPSSNDATTGTSTVFILEDQGLDLADWVASYNTTTIGDAP